MIHLDSDITLLQHLDELFTLPPTPMAMPRAHFEGMPPDQWPLSSTLMVLEPNPFEFDNLMAILQSWRLDPAYRSRKKLDAELINHRFAGSAMVLPHRPYILPSSEFRRNEHSAYLGMHNGPDRTTSRTRWDPRAALAEAKVVHFSDHPLPKPWVMWPIDGITEIQPDCGGQPSCAERQVWKKLYDDFRHRRKDICKILSAGSPKWADLKNRTDGYPMN